MASFNICTFLWSDPRAKHRANFEYTPEHVNKLFRALTKGMVGSKHKFVLSVVTDHSKVSDFDLSIPSMNIIPLWQDFRDLGRCFTKLKMFSRVHELIDGTEVHRSDFFPGDYIVTIDLDIVITDPKKFVKALTSNLLEPFKGYRDTKNPRCYSGALWRIDTRHMNEFNEVYDSFKHTYDTAKAAGGLEVMFQNWNVFSHFVGSDQSHITRTIGEKTYTNKWTGVKDGLWDFWNLEHLPSLPLNTCAVFMNGMRRDASMKEFQDKYHWVKEWWNNE